MSRILRKKLSHWCVQKARFLPLLSAKLIHSTHFHPIFVRLILIRYPYLHLYLRSTLFPSGFPTKIECSSVLLRTFHMLRLLQPLRSGHPNNWRADTWKKLHCAFFPTSTSYTLRKNIFHSTVPQKTNLSVFERNFSHPYQIIGTVIVLYFFNL